MILKKLIKLIRNTKYGIPLDKYIEICLYDNNYGYYKKNNPLGRNGDFVTSPEISQLFGEILGLYIYNFWKENLNNQFNLIELGPGNGTLIRDILRIRYYDDNGKKVGVEIPDLNHYHDLIKKYLNKYRNDLEENGYVLIKDFFTDSEAEEINNFRLELEELEEYKGKWMIYYEENNGNKLKSRIENFVNYKDNIKKFVDSKIKSLLESLLCEKMILFKEKINWKLPGGNGFKAHQDHPAWNDFNISKFYSVAIFGNNSTIENGCLQVSPQKNNQLFNDNGCISENIANSLDWKYVESTSKDLLIFDSFIPHKSDKNNSSKSRSIFYFTFNKLDEGNHYEKYVENKRKYFPPENERNNQNIDLDNNKYNLGNPLK